MSSASTQIDGKTARVSVALSVALIFFLCFTSGILTQRLIGHRQRALVEQPLRVFWEAWNALEQNFYGELPSPQTRTYGAIRGALELLEDPYTILLEPLPSSAERERLAGAYGGIGVELWWNSEGAVALSPYPDSPAETAGVREGDVLLRIDGEPVLGLSLGDIDTRLRGEIGSEVTLTISHPPTPPFDIVIARAEIRIPSVTYRVLDQNTTIGYVHIASFTERTADETEAAIQSLLAAGITRLVLDLRDNGGGLIQPARDVADMFLDEGVIMFEEQRAAPEQVFYSRDGGLAAGIPLVLLVNGSTASASEIVAGAIQSRDRAILIGEPTYGKGSVQFIYALSDGSSLHVTAAVWLLPGRQPISEDGLTPDILSSPANDAADAPLEQAIRYLETGE